MRFIAGIKSRLRTTYTRQDDLDRYVSDRIKTVPNLRRFGSGGCEWVIPESCLEPGAVCYCCGAGEDISFDMALARELQCEVHTFDPTPAAIAYVESFQNLHPTRIFFHPWGVWARDERVRFFAPKDSMHVSHSIVNLQKTSRFFEADCKRLTTIMRELGHNSLRLLKLDVEGAEYQVIESMLTDRIHPAVLAVEFDELHCPLDGGARSRIKETIERLLIAGYGLVSVDGANYTFVNGPRLSQERA
jgi:FkbM family methyltransferase